MAQRWATGVPRVAIGSLHARAASRPSAHAAVSSSFGHSSSLRRPVSPDPIRWSLTSSSGGATRRRWWRQPGRAEGVGTLETSPQG